MAIRTEDHPCVIAECDDCGEGVGSDDFGIVHFDNVEAALEAVTESEWRIERNGHGVPVKLVCASCVENEEIEREAKGSPGG